MSHGALLRQESDNPGLASHVMHDYRRADLDPQTRGILDFAAKLTREPSSMERSDVEALRELDLDDRQVLSVVLITCTFAFMTRLADGLGVEFPAPDQKYIEGWLTGPAARQEWMLEPKR